MDTILVTSYNNFDILAHSPKGNLSSSPFCLITENKLYFPKIGSLNPAFVLKHPDKNIIYVCSESINEGTIETYSFENQEFKKERSVSSGGKSACFITIDKKRENILVVNYWDSNISILPLKKGIAQEPKYIHKSKNKLISVCLDEHLLDRQSESHNHSLLFYYKENREIAIVPDLGSDKIKFFKYGGDNLLLMSEHNLKRGSGPRYLQLSNDVLYVVNELNSTVQVFSIILEDDIVTLSEKQTISTIPHHYKDYNTCGNILICPSKRKLFVSNRGHDSIICYKILKDNTLKKTLIFKSGGKTPRHFSINKNKLYIANQDSNNVVIFDLDNLKKSIFIVNSPNYILFL